MTRTPFSRSKGQRSRSQGWGHVVVAAYFFCSRLLTSKWWSSPPRRLCFQLCLSVCLFVGVSVNRITQKLLNKSLWNFIEFWIGHTPGTNQLDFEWPWRKVKVTRGQKVNIVFANNSVQSCPIWSRQKLNSSWFNSLNYYASAPYGGGIKRCFCLTSVWRPFDVCRVHRA